MVTRLSTSIFDYLEGALACARPVIGPEGLRQESQGQAEREVYAGDIRQGAYDIDGSFGYPWNH